MDELVEDVFLLLVDIKNVRLIWIGQIAVCLNHATQKVMAIGVLLAKCLLFAFIIKEFEFQAIKFGNMMVK